MNIQRHQKLIMLKRNRGWNVTLRIFIQKCEFSSVNFCRTNHLCLMSSQPTMERLFQWSTSRYKYTGLQKPQSTTILPKRISLFKTLWITRIIQPNHQVNSNFPGNDGEFDRKQNLFEFEFEFEYVIFTEGLIYENESISYTKRVKYDTFSE